MAQPKGSKPTRPAKSVVGWELRSGSWPFPLNFLGQVETQRIRNRIRRRLKAQIAHPRVRRMDIVQKSAFAYDALTRITEEEVGEEIKKRAMDILRRTTTSSRKHVANEGMA